MFAANKNESETRKVSEKLILVKKIKKKKLFVLELNQEYTPPKAWEQAETAE